MSEIELLRQFRDSRSESAFAALVHNYTGLVYSVAKRRAADAHLAEDIAQLVFIRLARNPPKVETEPEFLAWLHRTTVNVAIDMWRAASRRRIREEQAAPMQTTTPDWNVISPDLDEALDCLSDEDRQAILLRFMHAQSLREVGAALGISEDAAKMRVSRALDRLRSQLGISTASCTVGVLGTLLLQHSGEAAPPHLIAQLLKINVPVLSTPVASGSFLSRMTGAPVARLAGGLLLTAGLVCLFCFWPGTEDSPGIAHATTTPLIAKPPETLPPASAPNDTSPQPPAPEADINFRLHVIEADSQEPLPGAKIKYSYFGPAGEGESHNTVTDRSGEAVILKAQDPQKGGPNVFVSADWHVPKCVMFGKRTAGDYTLALDRARQISGWVIDEDNQPVADVTIHVEGPGNQPGQIENVDFQTCPVTTREDGSWSCTYIPLGYTEVRLELKKPGFAITFPIIPVGQVDLTRLVLVIDRGYTIEGQITDLQGIALSKARVRTLNWNSDERKSAHTDEAGRFSLAGVSHCGKTVYSSVTRPVVTNASGAFVIRGPALTPSTAAKPHPLEADLAVQVEAFASQIVTVRLDAPTNLVQIVMAPGKVLRGVLRDESGAPVAGAFVRTDMDFEKQIQTQFDWKTRTDASGRFEWDSAPAEPICYWFAAGGYEAVRGLPLTADGTEHIITLKRGR